MTDFELVKETLDKIGIGYFTPSENPNEGPIYLDRFAVSGGSLAVIKFYEDGKFQEFCFYPDEEGPDTSV